MTLQEILSGHLEYSDSWAVYAELDSEGHFYADSPARFGQQVFENGGLLDDCVYFASNTQIVDFLNEWNSDDPIDGIDELIYDRRIG